MEGSRRCCRRRRDRRAVDWRSGGEGGVRARAATSISFSTATAESERAAVPPRRRRVARRRARRRRRHRRRRGRRRRATAARPRMRRARGVRAAAGARRCEWRSDRWRDRRQRRWRELRRQRRREDITPRRRILSRDAAPPPSAGSHGTRHRIRGVKCHHHVCSRLTTWFGACDALRCARHGAQALQREWYRRSGAPT